MHEEDSLFGGGQADVQPARVGGLLLHREHVAFETLVPENAIHFVDVEGGQLGTGEAVCVHSPMISACQSLTLPDKHVISA